MEGVPQMPGSKQESGEARERDFASMAEYLEELGNVFHVEHGAWNPEPLETLAVYGIELNSGAQKVIIAGEEHWMATDQENFGTILAETPDETT